MSKLEVLIRSIYHIMITLPSIIYHGMNNTCNRFIFGSSEILVENSATDSLLSSSNYYKTIVFIHAISTLLLDIL